MCALGTFQDWHQRVPIGLLAEANPRLDVWHLLRCGGLVEGVVTELAIEGTVGGPRPIREVNLRRETPNLWIDETRVAITWDEPMPGVGRPWFECACGRRARYLYLRDTIRCARCHRLENASRHMRRQMPALGRVERLRRRLGDCELKPFAPLPPRRRGRSQAYHDKLVAMIHDEEEKLLDHLSGIVHDLWRRVRVRKARHQW